MQSVWTLRGPGPDHTGPSVFTLYLVGSEKPLKSFKGMEGSWAGLHCEILPALTVGKQELEGRKRLPQSMPVGQLIRQGWQWRWSQELFRRKMQRTDDGP